MQDDRGPTDPLWLLWARELQAIAQTGLAFTRDPYDRERYQRLRGLTARIMTGHTRRDVQPIEALFAGETGYATPKLDITLGWYSGTAGCSWCRKQRMATAGRSRAAGRT